MVSIELFAFVLVNDPLRLRFLKPPPPSRPRIAPAFDLFQILVGSSAGAVDLGKGSSCCRRLSPSAGASVLTMSPFPAPASSHAACGFPALRAPAHFASRVMGPKAFALTYILRLSSCRLTDEFIGSPLPRFVERRSCVQQGPFAPRALPRFNATTDPAATVSSSVDFPVMPVIRLTLLQTLLPGTRTASPVAWHVLVTVLSLPPRQRNMSHQLVCDMILLPSSRSSGLGLWGYFYPGHLRVHSCYGPVTRSPPYRRLCQPASSASFPPLM